MQTDQKDKIKEKRRNLYGQKGKSNTRKNNINLRKYTRKFWQKKEDQKDIDNE